MTMTDGEMTEFKGPPRDDAAERSLLGALLLSPNEIDNVAPIIAVEDFYRFPHQTIYEAICMVHRDGRPADPVTVMAELTRAGTAVKVGGGNYLLDMMAFCPVATNAVYYAEQVADKAILRRLQEAGGLVIQWTEGGAGGGASALDLVERARLELDKIAQGRGGARVTDVEDLVNNALDNLTLPEVPGVPTGITELDQVLDGGLRPGSMTIVAARPGVGKSLLLQQLAKAAASISSRGSMLFSLEMSEQEIMERLLAEQSGVPLTTLRRRTMAAEQWAMLDEASLRIARWPFAIVDDSYIGIAGITALARQRQRTVRGLGFIAVDYIQLMAPENRRDPREQQVAGNSRGLKRVARDLQVPLVVAAQLSRKGEDRADKTPLVSDLRESGSLEQDADTVILLDFDPNEPYYMTLIIGKNRHGRTGRITIPLDTKYARIGVK